MKLPVLALIFWFLLPFPVEAQLRPEGNTAGNEKTLAPNDYEAVRLQKVLAALRINEKITLDGKLNEPAWAQAQPATDFIQWEPHPGAPASDRTEVRVLYDDNNLYVGFMCFDAEPDRMVVNELKEDFAGGESDGVSITLDTLHDLRSGFIFATNPAGARRDYQIANDGAQLNVDWDGVWDVKVSRNDQGWIAEFVIPFKTLRFSQSSSQEWGINLLRRVRRTNEDSYWSPVPRRFRGMRVSLAGTLAGLEGIHQGRNFKVKPYVTGGISAIRNDVELKRTYDRDGGFDVKYGLTPSLTLDATYRTDFSQVEVDQQQVNLTRFNVFFPEKRDFFLENQGTFSFGGAGGFLGGLGGGGGAAAGGGGGGARGGRGGGGGANLIPFFSRRIGLSSTGTPIPIIGGSRLSGKAGNYDIGFLAMKTQHSDSAPSNDFLVGRMKRNLLKNSWIGALLTNRNSRLAGDYNRVFGSDAHFQFWDKLELDSYFLKSQTPGKKDHDAARKFEVAWRGDDLTVSTEYDQIQPNFNPEMGFVRRKDYTRYSGDFSWRPRLQGNKLIRNLNFSNNNDYFEGKTGKVETRTSSLTMGVFFQTQASLSFHVDNTFDRLTDPYLLRSISDLYIPAGDYTYRSYSINFNTDRSRSIAGNGNVSWGRFWNGEKRSFAGALDLKPNYHLNIDLSYNVNSVTLPLTNGAFRTNLVGTRVLYAFTSRMFLNAFVQYNADTHQVSSNIRFNITHHPLSDLYLVFNDRRDTITGQLLERAFIVKLTNLFNF